MQIEPTSFLFRYSDQVSDQVNFKGILSKPISSVIGINVQVIQHKKV